MDLRQSDQAEPHAACAIGDAHPDVLRWLRVHGAAEIEHPGGTLLAHLLRTARRLSAWQASPSLVLAGLCHATYGTQGFPVPLLQVAERAELQRLIGAEAEALVYAYCCHARQVGFPSPQDAKVRDRFTDCDLALALPLPQQFAELSAANELDVLAFATLSQAQRAGIVRLLQRCQTQCSPQAASAIQEELSGIARGA